MSRYLNGIVLAAVLLVLLAPTGICDPCCIDIRGDVDYDGSYEPNIADLVFLVDYMFTGGPPPPCMDEADIDGSGSIPDVADLVHLVNYMFEGGAPPADCEGDTPPDVILPLAIGNVLTSNYTEFNTSGGVIETGTATTTCVDSSIVNDTTWFLVEDSYDGVDTSLWANFADGAWSVVDTATPPEQLMLKYPANVGDSYGYDVITVYVDDTDALVTVPAGTFECYYYRVTVPLLGTIGKVWAAPNIGIVKAEYYELNFISLYLKTRIELIDYQLDP